MPARPAAVAALPAAPGVYRFRDDGGRVLYVGRARELRRRVGSYWGDLRDRRHLRRMMPRIAPGERCGARAGPRADGSHRRTGGAHRPA